LFKKAVLPIIGIQTLKGLVASPGTTEQTNGTGASEIKRCLMPCQTEFMDSEAQDDKGPMIGITSNISRDIENREAWYLHRNSV
jgi:hypothetical protein